VKELTGAELAKRYWTIMRGEMIPRAKRGSSSSSSSSSSC